MYYLHRYSQETNFDNEYYGERYLEPWVSLTEDIKKVNYNKNFDGYVRFDILSSGQIKWKSSDSNITRTIEYSKNGDKWTSITSTTGGTIINASAGDVIYFRGENQQYAEVIDPNYTTSSGDLDPYNDKNIRKVTFGGTTCNFRVSGNIMSLIKKDQLVFFKLKDLSGDCNFYGLFRVGSNLKSIENLTLPATGLTNGCYGFMFTSADTQTAMSLPAKKMHEACYRNMFSECKSLTTAPVLLNNDLATYCFSAMFAKCPSLQNVPNNYLPITNLEPHCYSSMFKGCSAFTTVPDLPATTLTEACYGDMFQGCTSLKTAPELPATTIAAGCYSGMFSGCTSLTTSPELPATTLMKNCYSSMFDGCVNLTGGTSELPATTVIEWCYHAMFRGCTNLAVAPKIMATTGGRISWAMEDMFNGCAKLDSLICLITDFFGYAPTNRWLNGVKEPGVFYKNPSATESRIRYNEGWGGSGNRIPESWTIEDYTA